MLDIKKARLEDIARITDISREAFSDSPGSAPEDFDSFRWYLNAYSNGYLFNILNKGDIIGFLAVFKTSRFCFELNRIYIDPDFRNLGLGKKAISFIVGRFPEAKVWYADVLGTDEAYPGFLTSCGFMESGFSHGLYTRFVKIV